MFFSIIPILRQGSLGVLGEMSDVSLQPSRLSSAASRPRSSSNLKASCYQILYIFAKKEGEGATQGSF